MRIVALTHIYPRDEHDQRGVYIRQMYERLGKRHSIRVLVPRLPQNATTANVDPFSYFVPRNWSTFGHGGALTGDQKLTKSSLLMAPLYAFAARGKVARARREADVVHAHFLVPNGAIAAAGKRDVPMVISLHGSDVYLAEKSGLMARAARYAIRRAAAIVPCSDDLGRRVIALGAKPENVHVIPYGADTTKFQAAGAGAREEIRKQAGVGDRPMVLFVGNLMPKKGVTHLVRAAVKVRAKRPDAAIVVVGSGPLREELEAQAQSLSLPDDTLRFVGERPWGEIPAWYAAADAFVAPSVVDAAGNVDGLPNVVLEAMATGLPVVASRVAGIAMAVRHEETGLLVSPGDEDSLADSLLRVLEDPARAKAWGARGREVITTELTWERIAERYEAIFERVRA